MNSVLGIVLWVMLAPFIFVELLCVLHLVVMAVRGTISGIRTFIGLVYRARPQTKTERRRDKSWHYD